MEDSYETMRPDLNQDLDKYIDKMVPSSCDQKEALIMKLEEIDNKIYHLNRSNKYLLEEIKKMEDGTQIDSDDDAGEETIQEYKDVITENEDVILDQKSMVYRIVSAFIRAGVNLQKEIYPKLKNKHLYLVEFEGSLPGGNS